MLPRCFRVSRWASASSDGIPPRVLHPYRECVLKLFLHCQFDLSDVLEHVDHLFGQLFEFSIKSLSNLFHRPGVEPREGRVRGLAIPSCLCDRQVFVETVLDF